MVYTSELPSAISGISSFHDRIQQLISHRTPVTLSELGSSSRGVDATGVVRVWPCERILAAALVSWAALRRDDSRGLMDGLRVLELGAGSSGLAGLALAGATQGSHVLITDGHPEAAQALALNIRLNTPGGTLGGCSGHSCIQSDCLVFDAAAAAARAAMGASMYSPSPLHSTALARGIVAAAASYVRGVSDVSRVGVDTPGQSLQEHVPASAYDSMASTTGTTPGISSVVQPTTMQDVSTELDAPLPLPGLDGSFNLIVAADILFFEDFHVDLLHAVAVLLAGVRAGEAGASRVAWSVAPPVGSADGDAVDWAGGAASGRFDPLDPRHSSQDYAQAWLIQPPRGGSLMRFVQRARAFRLSGESVCASGTVLWRPFDVEVYSDFDADVSAAHDRCASACGSGYNADTQRPWLVVLRLTGPPPRADSS